LDTDFDAEKRLYSGFRIGEEGGELCAIFHRYKPIEMQSVELPLLWPLFRTPKITTELRHEDIFDEDFLANRVKTIEKRGEDSSMHREALSQLKKAKPCL
jgi:hypothetical protein